MDIDKVIEGTIIGVLGGVFAGLGIWMLDRIRELYLFRRDEKRIFDFFTDHKDDDFATRNTYRIASEVNLPEDRVRFVASYSKKSDVIKKLMKHGYFGKP